MNHLHPSIAGQLQLEKSQRIFALEGARWVGYPQAQRALARMEELFSMQPKSRMPNALIVAHTNNGKTHILERFIRQHPAADTLTEDSVFLPIAYVQAPPHGDELSFYNGILENFSVPFRPREPASSKLNQVLVLMRAARTKMLIVDEVQHLLAGDRKTHRTMLNAIKYIGNALKIPIVAAGVESAFNAVQIDPQIANRFQTIPLPRWKRDSEWSRLLSTFEMLLPLANPSGLAADKLSQKLWQMSEGLIGELSDLLSKSGKEAIQSGIEHITPNILDSLDWIQPSARRRKVETLLEA